MKRPKRFFRLYQFPHFLGSNMAATVVVVFVLISVLAGSVTSSAMEDPVTVLSVIRHYRGDIYTINRVPQREKGCGCGRGSEEVSVPGQLCQCQCDVRAPTFRDDTRSCVHKLTECPLADFVSASGAEKIPYVYMPLKGQLVHPTAEVALMGLEHGGSPLVSPVCVVTKGRLMSAAGWLDMANTTTFEPPFRLFRDGGRTYVQWVGEAEARHGTEGRLVLVSLICRDAAMPDTPLFRPCLAFRVAGSPASPGSVILSTPVGSRRPKKKTEEDFGEEKKLSGGLSSGEIIIIGLVVSCLAIIYLVSMVVFLRIRKKRRKLLESREKVVEEGLRSNSKRSKAPCPPRPTPKPSLVSSEDDSDHEDLEDLSQASKIRKANRESTLNFTTAVVHDESDVDAPSTSSIYTSPIKSGDLSGSTKEGLPGDTGETQCPQGKKKLYFNPAYFEPDLLQSPPPAALEFLSKIREMISVAKNKMKSKAYQPRLVDIPEDDYNMSRPPSSAAGRSTGQAETIPEEEDEREEDYAEEDRHSDKSSKSKVCTSKEGGSGSVNDNHQEGDSRSSTLKRLAKRVNSQGQSIVSEIIKTLDLKPRLPRPDSANIYGTRHLKGQAPQPPNPPPRPVNARETIDETEDEFPELIKPSMLRSVLRDGKKLTDLNNTFENFRQEMMATFNRMKKVGEAISPKNTLNRNKKKDKPQPPPSGTVVNKQERASPDEVTSEGKVHRWLQTLDGKNSYKRMKEKNVIFDSRASLNQNGGTPPPLPEKAKKPPSPPRRQKPPSRSVSFCETSSTISQNLSNGRKSESITKKSRESGKNGVPLHRSLSWQNEHCHYDSHPRRTKPPVPLPPEESHNTSFGSEDDALSDLLSEAEAKMPKVITSDSDSVYSDTLSGGNSLEQKKTEGKNNSKILTHQLPREEEMTARNEIFNKNTGTKTISRLESRNYEHKHQGQDNTNDGYDDDEYDDEHMYEEIEFPANRASRSKKKRAPTKPLGDKRTSSSNKNHQQRRGTEEDVEGLYSIYSNPESLVSEIKVSGKSSSSELAYAGSKLSITLQDSPSAKRVEEPQNFDPDTLEKKEKGLERSNSIVQDSLERPKVKKRSSDLVYQEKEQNIGTQSEKIIGHEKSLLDIYEARSSMRSAKSGSPESVYSQHKGSKSSPMNNRPEPFFLSSKSESKGKNLRTFKDYQEMRFTQPNNDSDSPLPVVGSSINLKFRSGSPGSKDSKNKSESPEDKPPLPPKYCRAPEVLQSSPELPPKGPKNDRPPLPLKTVKRSESIDTDSGRPKLPEKCRRKNSFDSLSRSSSGSSIPELTEEEARSILHGLLSHVVSDHARLSPLHEEEDNTDHFLALGNTAGDRSRELSSVPLPDSDTCSSSSSPDTVPSALKSSDIENLTSDSKCRPEKNHEKKVPDSHDYPSGTPDSPENEERVSGEFILSTIKKSASLRRERSINRDSKNAVLNQLRILSDGTGDADGISKGMEIALALKAKTDLEKHFKEKSGADSIKRTWRKIIEKVDDSKEEKDKLSIMELQQYMASLEQKEKEAKLKHEDSGYQSTDSSDSNKSRQSEPYSSFSSSSTMSLGQQLQRNILGFSSGSLKTLSSRSSPLRSPGLSSSFSLKRPSTSTTPLFQRSFSLQQLSHPSSQESSGGGYESNSFQRASMRASMGRRHKIGHPDGGLSVYINNIFNLEDEEAQAAR
ncbi:shavenoid isoform X2 [Oratosquilla oratoria]|uniref:shavenoid isoform X2 n=1 Tax=Oratosquilla oratoria TaxID=337810 RepID=UPI003F76653E